MHAKEPLSPKAINLCKDRNTCVGKFPQLALPIASTSVFRIGLYVYDSSYSQGYAAPEIPDYSSPRLSGYLRIAALRTFSYRIARIEETKSPPYNSMAPPISLRKTPSASSSSITRCCGSCMSDGELNKLACASDLKL